MFYILNIMTIVLIYSSIFKHNLLSSRRNRLSFDDLGIN